MLGSALTVWSIRIALLLYLVSTAREIAVSKSDRVAKFAWLGGCVFFLVHVFCAFWFHHQMSHALALENTAERTQQMLGFRFGEGIYFSYLFGLLWTWDAVWRVGSPSSYSGRAAWLHVSIHTYLFFIAFNGAVIFEGGLSRWGFLLGCAALAGLATWRIRQDAQRKRSHEKAALT